jgi:PIN domain nuclease of toxin-antitoxin system
MPYRSLRQGISFSALASKGRIRLDISLETFLREVESRFVVLPITARACVLSLELPAVYREDSADRITRRYGFGRRVALTDG